MTALSTGPAPAVASDPGRVPTWQVEPADVAGAGGAVAWAAGRRDVLRDLVTTHGSLLVRGLGLDSVDQVGRVFAAVGTDLTGDEEGFAQRHHHGAGVYSSAQWPDQQPMCMHHELSYRREVPALLLLACLTAPAGGGGTGVADASAVLDALPTDLVSRLESEGWLLRRTYGGDVGPSVAEAFGTDDRAAVEAYCAAHAIEHEWQPGGELRTRQRRAAVVRHPRTGRRCWFNQVAFLSEWTLDPEVREFLVDVYGIDALPFSTAFGGGDPLGPEVVAEINAVYDRLAVREPWRAGDLMLVDNIATAHDREAFDGPREVLVGLSDPWRSA